MTTENPEVKLLPPPPEPKKGFINRELSWLAFNRRVIEQANRQDIPFHKRLTFIGIADNNLDEFISVRFAGLHHTSSDGDSQYRDYQKVLAQILEQKSIILNKASSLLSNVKLNDAIKSIDEPVPNKVIKYFEKEIYPILTPILLGQNKEVPKFNDKDVNLFIKLKGDNGSQFAFLQIPHQIDRVVRIDKEYYYTEDIVRSMLPTIFNSVIVDNVILFKVNKEYDAEIDTDDQVSIIERVNDVLIKREENNIIFVEVNTCGKTANDVYPLVRKLLKLLNVSRKHLYLHSSTSCNGKVLNQKYLMNEPFKKFHIENDVEYIPLKPRVPSELDGAKSILDYLDDDDLILHHPYDTYDVFISFLREAASDPDVITIKQTLYRVSSEKSPIIKALCQAALSGKKVTVMLELLARFDEKQNIRLINTLNQAGCNIVYSLDGLKTHAKMCIVTKHTKNGIVTYSHVGTGNYNEKSAKIYTDISYFTSKRIIGKELTDVFNMITGLSIPQDLMRIKYSPNTLRSGLVEEIEKYAKLSTEDEPSILTFKLNSLSDAEFVYYIQDILVKYPTMKLNIICRGICSLPVNLPNLKVKSIIGRYLEHSRIYSFSRGGKTKVFISSADLLTRNLDRRIEIMTPIDDKDCRKKLVDILEKFMSDTTNSYELVNSSYVKVEDDGNNSHSLFIKKG